MSGDILFLAHRLPFPPDRGDKIRSHHILRHLCSIAPVHVGCLADETDLDHVGQLDGIAASHCVEPRRMPLPLAGLLALARMEPVSMAAFRNARLARYVRETIARHDIRAIYAFSGQMGQYVPACFNGRLVLDFGDVDSAKFDAYAQESKFPMRWVHCREGRLLRMEEQRLARRASHTLFVSDAEAALFVSRLDPGVTVNVGSIANGIDSGVFDPDSVLPQPELSGTPGPHIVFTGQMDYPPNIAAARRMALQLMPIILARCPEAQCHVVGRSPPHAVRSLDGVNGCRVWGEVPDVRPFLACADVVLVPLEIARGVQNKVLEAMAMARPVVLTQGAATGIAGRNGEHFLIGDSDAELAALVGEILSDRARASAMGNAARRFVIQNCDWNATVAPLAGLLGIASGGKGRAAA